MSDLHCQVCGEPYEDYHVMNDMPDDERKEFLGGQGCEACHGKVPEGGRPDRAEFAAVVLDIMGDDLDAAAGEMSDLGF